MLKTALPRPRVQVWSLVGELRSHVLNSWPIEEISNQKAPCVYSANLLLQGVDCTILLPQFITEYEHIGSWSGYRFHWNTHSLPQVNILCLTCVNEEREIKAEMLTDYLSCLALAPSLLQFFLPPSHPSAPLPSFSPQKLFTLIYRKALAIIMPSSPCKNVLSIFPLFFFFQQGNSQPSFRSHIIHYVYWYPFLNCSDYGESSLNTCKAPWTSPWHLWQP